MRLPQKNWLEWAVFAGGLAVILAVVGFLAYDALAGDEGPPRLAVDLGEAEARDGHFAVPVVVRNLSPRAVEQVAVEVVLRGAGRADERASFELDLLPRYGAERGEVVFTGDPARGRLEGYASGYITP